MNRLTYRDNTVPHINAKGELWEAYSDYDYNEVINKLAAYEDAEEQGRLAEVQHGRWEFEDDDCVTWCTKAICSSCKQTVALNADLTQDWGKRLFLKDNLFCPKCGAKMDGGQDE